jgi:hypothetical protein
MGVSSPWPRSIVLGLGPISTRNTINPVRQNCFSLRWYPESLFQRMLPTHVPLRWLTSLQCSLPMTLFTSGIDQPESGTERWPPVPQTLKKYPNKTPKPIIYLKLEGTLEFEIFSGQGDGYLEQLFMNLGCQRSWIIRSWKSNGQISTWPQVGKYGHFFVVKSRLTYPIWNRTVHVSSRICGYKVEGQKWQVYPLFQGANLTISYLYNMVHWWVTLGRTWSMVSPHPPTCEAFLKITKMATSVFFKEFLFVAKVAIVHRKMYKKWQSSSGIFSHIWLLVRNKVQIFNHPSIFLSTHWKPNKWIWWF